MNKDPHSIHIYTAKDQSATRYRCDAGFHKRNKPRKLLWAWCCDQKRWAKNLIAHSYYDGDRFFCKQKKGCHK